MLDQTRLEVRLRNQQVLKNIKVKLSFLGPVRLSARPAHLHMTLMTRNVNATWQDRGMVNGFCQGNTLRLPFTLNVILTATMCSTLKNVIHSRNLTFTTMLVHSELTECPWSRVCPAALIMSSDPLRHPAERTSYPFLSGAKLDAGNNAISAGAFQNKSLPSCWGTNFKMYVFKRNNST